MDKRGLFDREYFEEGKYLQVKRVYNWESTKLYFGIIASSIKNAIDPKIALDIGCAKGYLVYLLEELGIKACGVDISAYAISCAPEKIRNNLKTLDIEKDALPFPDDHFDLVIILEVLEHLSSFEHLPREIRRILKKGGYVLVITPTPKGKHSKMDKTHINVQSRRFWINLFSQYDLVLIKDDIWRNFKLTFLKEFKKVMPENPPSTKISATLMKMGKIGNCIRNNIFPYLDYFSPLRSSEILLFKKAM